MIIMFTEEEKKYLTVEKQGDYGLGIKEDAPENIAKSIRQKINQHKKWLKEGQ